eukprot:scaffold103175_cov30-Phaeocystis_antarctica.AAC.2
MHLVRGRDIIHPRLRRLQSAESMAGEPRQGLDAGPPAAASQLPRHTPADLIMSEFLTVCRVRQAASQIGVDSRIGVDSHGVAD